MLDRAFSFCCYSLAINLGQLGVSSHQIESINSIISTVYTHVQVDSSISRIEILKSLFGPSSSDLSIASMARLQVELKKKLSDFAQNFLTYTQVYTVIKLNTFFGRFHRPRLLAIEHQSLLKALLSNIKLFFIKRSLNTQIQTFLNKAKR